MKGSTKMIVIKDNERHHATSWQYNSARILTHLAQLITAQGGKVKPLPSAVLSDRNLEEACTATQRRIESSYKAGLTSHPKERETQISNLQKELARFQAIPNAPITVTHTSYIDFTMNGVYYSYSLNDNPFFPFYYLKPPSTPKAKPTPAMPVWKKVPSPGLLTRLSALAVLIPRLNPLPGLSSPCSLPPHSPPFATIPSAPASPTLTMTATTLKISPSKSAALRLIFERQNAAPPFITTQFVKERLNQK